MKDRNPAFVCTVSMAVALMIGVGAAGVEAQTPKPAAGKSLAHQGGMKETTGTKSTQGMKGMDMNGMMTGGPHEVLAMAYRDNIVTFAKALRDDANRSKTVNLDMARPALTEMRRSFDQMKQHHQANLAMMGDHMDSSMSAMKQHTETHLTALNEHLTALEAEITGTAPDAKKVSAHATEVMKECAGMSGTENKTKAGKK